MPVRKHRLCLKVQGVPEICFVSLELPKGNPKKTHPLTWLWEVQGACVLMRFLVVSSEHSGLRKSCGLSSLDLWKRHGSFVRSPLFVSFVCLIAVSDGPSCDSRDVCQVYSTLGISGGSLVSSAPRKAVIMVPVDFECFRGCAHGLVHHVVNNDYRDNSKIDRLIKNIIKA